MHKVLAAVGLAVAVPVALAAPALAKPPVTGTSTSISSLLKQHEGFRAEVTYLCTGPKHQEGTITVVLQQPAKPGASKVSTVGTAYDEAKCDGKKRDETIKIPVSGGALQADQPVWLYTTLVVNGVQLADHESLAEPITAVAQPTPSPTPTESATPSASATPTETATPSTDPTASSTPTETATPSADPTASSTPTETATPSTGPTASSTPTETATPSADPTASSTPTESSSPETETSSPSPIATS